ncbi:MAG: NADH-quinone oxidoreductase subunit M [Gammaproteobacteria bacterium]|nr:MAG: NADH-quinone oxidoreductase subunit M [Gammaproteobacteria bacterium]
MFGTEIPLISLMIFTLPLGVALIWLLPDSRHARMVALLTGLVDMLIALITLYNFDPGDASHQLIDRWDWIPSLNIQYTVGIDGISVLFLPLTILLFIGVVLASWTSIRSMPKLYYSLLLILESAMLGIFSAMDTILFLLFWELTLIPIYFLISLWGVGPNRRYAAVKYTFFMMAGGVPLLFGFILLAFTHAEMSGVGIPSGLVFDYTTLLEHPVPAKTQTLVFFLLLLGFAVKMPVFPLHTWLPTVAMEGPVSVITMMAGLKLGLYGLIRFVIPLSPQASQEFHWLLAGLGVFGIIYGALVALSQTNLRRMLAFSSISHVGLVILGISSFTIEGFQGAIFQLINFTFIAGGLFLLTGFMHHRVGSTDVASLGGVASSMPLIATFFFLFGIASIGVPGTSGFPAEFLLILSTLKVHTGAGIAALAGIILSAAYFLRIYRMAFMGPIKHAVIEDAADLRRRELGIILVMAILILTFGIYPNGILDQTRLAGESWVSHLTSLK